MNKRVKIIVNEQEIWNSEKESDEQNEELLSKVEQWIKENVVFRKLINHEINSYHIKHIIEKEIGEYVSNVDVKRVMARLGIKGKLDRVNSFNYCYPICKHRRCKM